MSSFHCPYCNAIIVHRPELAGERVACSKCRGEFYEPTDPLPGMLPEKAEPVEAAAESGIKEPAVQNPVADVRPSLTLSHANDITTCDPSDMVAEMARRGEQAIMITWKSGNESKAEVAVPEGLPQDEAKRAIYSAALEAMKLKWPDLYEMLKSRLFM